MTKSLYKLNYLFPVDYKSNHLSDIIKSAHKYLNRYVKKANSRVINQPNKDEYDSLVAKYSHIPNFNPNPSSTVSEMARDFFEGIPRWRSPNLQYNIGAAVNIAASAIYALALDENIYNINSGLAGNALAAEKAITEILAKLANIKTTPYGLFTFGGTSTNMYSIKIGTRKADPLSGKRGISKRTKVFVTEDSHFSHAVSADWLGIGTNNVITIKADSDRRSNLEDARIKIEKTIQEGNLVSTIVINGGTTYSHTIDDIKGFINLRNEIVNKYKLKYKPHIHVDSVIGWAWLMFSDYDFINNPLKIKKNVLYQIKKQYNRIKHVNLADSWGIDFHKGVGACPVDCSVFMCNNQKDLLLLSKSLDRSTGTHQLAQEFSFLNPSDYTLETSRAGGAPLAALASLHTLGLDGYRINLANLISFSILLRELANNSSSMSAFNSDSLGYVSMLRLYPPGIDKETFEEKEKYKNSKQICTVSEQINSYNKEFYQWDLNTRIKKNDSYEYSFTSAYLISPSGCDIAALKFYPVSPYTTDLMATGIIDNLSKSKYFFDSNIWNQNPEKLEINTEVKEILNYIYDLLRINKFIFYGGSVMDLLIYKKPKINDYDIAIPTRNTKTIKLVTENLIKHGYKILENRKYYINIETEIDLIYAIKGDKFLDIAFMDNVEEVGQFSIGSLYCKYPEMVIVDRYDAIKDLRNKKLRLIRGLTENPYMLLSIVMKLCAKYSINIKDKDNLVLINSIVHKAKRWSHPNRFHNEIAKASTLSSFLKSIVRSADKYYTYKFFEEMGLVDLFFPSIKKLKFTINDFEKINNKTDLVFMFVNKSPKKDLIKISKSIQILAARTWDEADMKLLSDLNHL